MSRQRRLAGAGVLGVLVLIVAAVAASAALADVRLTRAEMNGTSLRLEGTAIPNRTITVGGNGIPTVAMGTSDAAGNFRIDNNSFTPPADCIVHVNDGSATDTPVTPTGCTRQTQPPPPGAQGSISIIPGGNGHGVITSSPAGINCTIAASGVTGPCSAFFAAGTIVRLDARPAADSSFQGWRGLPGCFDASKVKVFADTNINCQPGFSLKF